jgi:hypothetical protein
MAGDPQSSDAGLSPLAPAHPLSAERGGIAHSAAVAVPVSVASRSTRGMRETASVRKQYHFWTAERGFDAWDVDRLIELSRGLPVERVPVNSIREIDRAYWFDVPRGKQEAAGFLRQPHAGRVRGANDLTRPVSPLPR